MILRQYSTTYYAILLTSILITGTTMAEGGFAVTSTSFTYIGYKETVDIIKASHFKDFKFCTNPQVRSMPYQRKIFIPPRPQVKRLHHHHNRNCHKGKSTSCLELPKTSTCLIPGRLLPLMLLLWNS